MLHLSHNISALNNEIIIALETFSQVETYEKRETKCIKC